MKRVLLAVLAVALLAGGALANPPVINIRAIYKDDGSSVDFSSIKPYKELKILCLVTADTPLRNFEFKLIVDGIDKGFMSGGAPDYEFELWVGEFASEETGYFSIRARDSNDEETTFKQDITTLYGILPVTGIELFANIHDTEYYTKNGSISFDLDLYWDTILQVMIIPSKATNKNIRWSSSNEKAVIIESPKKEVTRIKGISPGRATITAITEDGGFTVSCDITVKGPEPSTPTSQKSSGSSGGCNAGLMGLFALALLPVVRKYRTTAQR